MTLNEAEKQKWVEKIKKAIGRPVEFGYPEGTGLKGVLRDRCCIFSGYAINEEGEPGIPYFDVADLIEVKTSTAHAEAPYSWLRFGYYRVKNNELKWASQTTLADPIETYRALFVKAAKEHKWFRDSLEQVLAEVEN